MRRNRTVLGVCPAGSLFFQRQREEDRDSEAFAYCGIILFIYLNKKFYLKIRLIHSGLTERGP